MLGRDAIDELKEEGLRGIFRETERLQKPVELGSEILSNYGLNTAREQIKHFLYGEEAPLEVRFDEVTAYIPELPVEALMEIATFASPRDFCIWDEDAKRTIVFVGHNRMHGLSENAFTGKISGWEYVACKTALNHMKEQLRAYVFGRVDFVDTMMFTQYVSKNIMPRVLTYPDRE